MLTRRALASALGAASLVAMVAAQDGPAFQPTVDNFTIDNFEFSTGEKLPQLRIHYRTLGEKKQDGNGKTTNAVLIMHGTSGSGGNFLNARFGNELFAKGQPLDMETHFIIMPDGIGHGQSSKPSDGLKARFPKYGYRDMVKAHHALVTEHLGVNHLRLVMGTSMGGMHSWLMGGMYPDLMDALFPLASVPTQISGRNRMMRRVILTSIQEDPNYKDGEYESPPIQGLKAARAVSMWMSSVPLQMQKDAPTTSAADEQLAKTMSRFESKPPDANDLLYQYNSSTDYDPEPLLPSIKAQLVAVNSADDQINPPELGILEENVKKIPDGKGKAVMIPISDETSGHGTHSIPKLWKEDLVQLLGATEGG
ncbi:hypothetical protein G6O67_005932 [Ophiocordyceps sinensis]|uniref:AB hydrolase-1 domain-containing protein n=1 Tax=Ophiocordyceps sinensis TaxID=72228 RepID=A0A8H4LY01_9HYPO|nr:hypothetical protein G6O67_005932 [Ophiocordyceps sinensis]